MSTCPANVFGEPRPALDEAYEMAARDAGERMPDAPESLPGLQEAVATAARVFDPAVPGGHGVHAMAEQPAQIPHLLRKAGTAGIRAG